MGEGRVLRYLAYSYEKSLYPENTDRTFAGDMPGGYLDAVEAIFPTKIPDLSVEKGNYVAGAADPLDESGFP